MIELVLKPERGFKALQLVRIQCPIYQSNSEKENSFDEESARIFKVDQVDVALRKALDHFQALCTGEHPFVAWPIGPALIQLVCTKKVVAKLFKALFAQQRILGIRLTDLKSHVILSPMDPEELLQACSSDVLSSLQKHSSWHPVYSPSPDQAGTLLLGLDPMSNADGKPQVTPMLDIKIETCGNDALVLFLKPSTVRFRHCCVAAFSNPSALSEASEAAQGSLCRVLPTLTPAIIHRLRIASDKEAKRIEFEWSRAGYSLPLKNSSDSSSAAASFYNLVDVRFEEDEDAPTTPFPACSVLSYLGLDPVDTKLNSPGVLGALHRLQEDLRNATYKLFGGGSRTSGLLIKEMRRWDATSTTFQGNASSISGKRTGFQSAAGMTEAAPAAAAAAAPPSAVEKLGEVIDFFSLQAGIGGGDGSGQGTIAKFKKPHARAGPDLLAYLAKLEKEEAAEAAAEALNNPQKKTALPPSMALAAQTATAAPLRKVPLLGAKRTLQTAAAATEKKGKAKAPKKAAASAPGGSKPAAAPKADKPKPPAAEIDVASLDVPGLVATGKLASLTIPQLKAYCRSIKQPVGGKKSDLETRIKSHLGISVEQ